MEHFLNYRKEKKLVEFETGSTRSVCLSLSVSGELTSEEVMDYEIK